MENVVMKLTLDMFSKPMGQVETTQGTIYIYSPSKDDYLLYADLIDETPQNRAQIILLNLISMVSRTSFSEPLHPVEFQAYLRFSEADINLIVDFFQSKLGISCEEKITKSDKMVMRNTNENALVFLDRIFQAEIKTNLIQ